MMAPLDKAMLALVRCVKARDDADPDVGMGPFPRTLMDTAMSLAEVTRDQFDYHGVMAKFNGEKV